jgi:hypothetical protein
MLSSSQLDAWDLRTPIGLLALLELPFSAPRYLAHMQMTVTIT